jgi:hypothetical protein
LVSALALLLTGVIAMSMYASHASAATAGSISWSGPTRFGNFAQPAEVDLSVTTPDTNPAQRYRVRVTHVYAYSRPGEPVVEPRWEPYLLTEQLVGSSWQQVTGEPEMLGPTSGFAAGTTQSIRLRLRALAGTSAELRNGADSATVTTTADLVPVDPTGKPIGPPVATAERVFQLVPLRLARSWPTTIRIGEPTSITFTYINDSDTAFVPGDRNSAGENPYAPGAAIQDVSIVGNARCHPDITPGLPVLRMPPHTTKSFRLTVTMWPRYTCDYTKRHAWHPWAVQHGLLTLGFTNGFDTEAGQAYYNVPITILPERVVAASPTPRLPATGRPVRAELLIGFVALAAGLLLQLMSVWTRRPASGKR